MDKLIPNIIANITNFFNLKYSTKPDISSVSLSKALLIFYVLIAGSFTKELYGGQFRDYLKNSRSAQHIMGFLTMLVLITCVAGVNDPYHSLTYSTVAYFWFVLTTKLDIHWNLAIIALLVVGFFYESKMLEKETKSEEDPVLEEEDINNIKTNNNNKKSLIVMLVLIITIIGTVCYWKKKKAQYGPDFDTQMFLFKGRKTYKLTR